MSYIELFPLVFQLEISLNIMYLKTGLGVSSVHSTFCIIFYEPGIHTHKLQIVHIHIIKPGENLSRKTRGNISAKRLCSTCVVIACRVGTIIRESSTRIPGCTEFNEL